MLTKKMSRDKKSCRVTFELPAGIDAANVSLCGEFNEWNPSSHPMKRRKDGGFSLAINLKPGRQYRFRYLLDGKRWINDPQADGLVANPFGSEDSFVQT